MTFMKNKLEFRESNKEVSKVMELLETTHLQEEHEVKEEEKAENSLEELEEILNYRFNDRKLLLEALTHPSYFYPEKLGSYERLEYMGDSILNVVMAKLLFFTYPELSPGPLTRLRAANVDTEKLARVSLKHEFYRFLRHKAPPIVEQIQEFSKEILDYPIHSNGLVDTPKFLADIVESIMGAIFVDSNCSIDTVWEVFKVLLQPLITLETMGIHPVTELFELCQKNGRKLRFERNSWKENSCVDVYIDDILVATGKYHQKKDIAQNRAAKATLEHLKRNLN